MTQTIILMRIISAVLIHCNNHVQKVILWNKGMNQWYQYIQIHSVCSVYTSWYLIVLVTQFKWSDPFVFLHYKWNRLHDLWIMIFNILTWSCKYKIRLTHVWISWRSLVYYYFSIFSLLIQLSFNFKLSFIFLHFIQYLHSPAV